MDYTTSAMEWTENTGSDGYVFDASSLYAHLARLTDKRQARGKRYPLALVLLLIVLAKLSGEDKPLGIAEWAQLRADWLVDALDLKHETMPSYTTYSRVLGYAVEIEEFESVVGRFFSQIVGPEVMITLDGKTLRGTIAPGETQGVHLLAAYVPQAGVVLLQTEVDGKENELTAAPRVLAALDLAGQVVTGDAMFAQRTLSAQIVEAGGDYLWTVKDNQPTLREDIERLFAPEYCLPGHSPLQHDFATATEVSKAHGRVERRTLTASSLLQAYSDWPSLNQVIKIERDVLHLASGKQTHEIAYLVTSLSKQAASPQRLLALTRTHWHIENRLHYPRDVSLLEDRCRLRMGQAARAMAIINNLVVGLIRQQHFDYVPSARRYYEARREDALALLLSPLS